MSFLLKNKTLFSINTNLIVLIVVLCCQSFAISAEHTIRIISEDMSIKVDEVFDGLNTPWGMAFLTKTKLLVTEREGNILLLNLDNSTKLILRNTPKVLSEGQGGMLDIILSPNYKSTGWIYLTYVKEIDEEGVTVLARAKLNKDKFYDWQELLITDSANDTSHHFGSRIAFDNKGHIFFGVGDRGARPNSQDLTNHAGSIMRLNLDGTIPKDNPFINHKVYLPEIWSYGHRNPQGMAFDEFSNKLWEIEHGPRGGDEINLIKSGVNYGWPVISYGKEYWGPISVGEGTHRRGMEQPIKYFVPSIAPGSLIIYSGNAFPQWKGNLFSGALKLRHINRIVLNSENKAVKEERLLETLDERIRAITQSPEGWLYFSTDSGKIYRLSPLH